MRKFVNTLSGLMVSGGLLFSSADVTRSVESCERSNVAKELDKDRPYGIITLNEVRYSGIGGSKYDTNSYIKDKLTM